MELPTVTRRGRLIAERLKANRQAIRPVIHQLIGWERMNCVKGWLYEVSQNSIYLVSTPKFDVKR